MVKRRVVKILGYIVTVIIFIIGIAPSIFKIPVALHPWILLASILWIVAFSSGVFSS